MRTRISRAVRGGLAAMLAFSAVGFARTGHAAPTQKDTDLINEADHTIAVYRRADPGIDAFFRQSVGYVVFPGAGKGGLGIGGAHGTGVLYEHGSPVGKVSMSQVTIGAQAGGQEFSEIVFFQVPKPMNDLKMGNYSVAAQVSAVALSAGASAKARFKNGIAVFTATKGGLMLEASVGGQKLSYTPFSMP
jgi:lipid-binding SYLF domain-containing protein